MPPIADLCSRAADHFRGLQDRITTALGDVDGGQFREDVWQRAGGGGGRTRILANGRVLEKAGVNFSEVSGEFSAEFAAQIPGEGLAFTATGISLVLHPRSPLVPTVHANFRFLSHGARQWFGGGADLTPYYPYREDVIHFHRVWQRVCENHAGIVDYGRLKRWCDEYFFLPHRGEARGVGGIFFDYLEGPSPQHLAPTVEERGRGEGGDLEKVFAFVRDCGDAFVDAYLPIVRRRKEATYTDQQRAFQEYRRGRYVEFNLLYDRGTLFGLKTAGRTESILMSLPPVVRWEYDYHPAPGSREAELTEHYLKPRDWANETI